MVNLILQYLYKKTLLHVSFMLVYDIIILGVPKLFVQINAGGREHENKYISLWYIWSLTAISDARDDLQKVV